MRKGKRTFASRKRKIAGLSAFVLAGVIGVGAYAFTAANTVPAQSAGAGSTLVGKYVESGVDFEWNVEGTENTAVNFILKGEQLPTDVAIALTKAVTPEKADEWQDCTGAHGEIEELKAEEYEVECKFEAPVANAAADYLAVAAVSEGKVKIQ